MYVRWGHMQEKASTCRKGGKKEVRPVSIYYVRHECVEHIRRHSRSEVELRVGITGENSREWPREWCIAHLERCHAPEGHVA